MPIVLSRPEVSLTPPGLAQLGQREPMKTLHILAALVATLLLAPLASAHPHGTIVDANGTRCYIVTDGFATLDGRAEPEFWIETNGELTGGDARGAVNEETGFPVAGLPYWDLAGEFVFGALNMEPGDLHESLEDGQTGLQRTAGSWGAADTRVDAAAWANQCLA